VVAPQTLHHGGTPVGYNRNKHPTCLSIQSMNSVHTSIG
jgi:hypothetical protein